MLAVRVSLFSFGLLYPRSPPLPTTAVNGSAWSSLEVPFQKGVGKSGGEGNHYYSQNYED